MSTIIISLLADGAIPVDEYEENDEGINCPLPTQDEEVNAEYGLDLFINKNDGAYEIGLII